MMRIGSLCLLILFLTSIGISNVAAQSGPIIVSPRQSDVLQGVATIKGSSALEGFISSEVSFAYADDTTGTWFLINTSNQEVNSDILAIWDTSTITDGNYALRLRVYLNGGSFQDFLVPNLHVRNYTAIETPTPAPTPLQPTATPTVTMTATTFPSPTPLPPNPAYLTSMDVLKSILYGGMGGLLFLVVLGIYLGLSRR